MVSPALTSVPSSTARRSMRPVILGLTTTWLASRCRSGQDQRNDPQRESNKPRRERGAGPKIRRIYYAGSRLAHLSRSFGREYGRADEVEHGGAACRDPVGRGGIARTHELMRRHADEIKNNDSDH